MFTTCLGANSAHVILNVFLDYEMSDFSSDEPLPPPEKKEEKEEQKEEDKTKTKKEEEEEGIAARKTRKVRSIKFTPEMLINREKGLAALHKKLENFQPSKYPSQKEAFHQLMKIYQRWAYRMYPAEFLDTCWKIAGTSGCKTAVRNFIYELNGVEPMVYDSDHPDGVSYFNHSGEEYSDGEFKPEKEAENKKEEEQNAEKVPEEQSEKSNVNFLSDENSSDNEGDSQSIPEILDLFASQRNRN